MKKPNPLVSIITITLNAGGYLEETVKSVAKQVYKNIEYIVIDGGSTDNSLEVIKQYGSNISYWISEPDEGISDAFNKGILASTGEWIVFLNAGDLFENNSVISDWIAHADGNRIVTSFAYYSDNEKRTIPKSMPSNSQPLAKKSLISHQATMIRRQVFNEYGLYKKSYKVRMDYEFWLRVLKKEKFKFIPIRAIKYDTSGVSFVNKKLFYEEEIKANIEHLPPWYGIYWNNRSRFRRMVKAVLGLG